MKFKGNQLKVKGRHLKALNNSKSDIFLMCSVVLIISNLFHSNKKFHMTRLLLCKLCKFL